MRRYQKRGGRDNLVSAAEIASWTYCPEQWRLQYGQGLAAANQAELDAGTRHHEQKAVVEQVAGGSIALGRILAVLAVVVLLWSSGGCHEPSGRVDRSGGGVALLLGLCADAGGPGYAETSRPRRGKTVSLDRVTLTSMRLGLTGRPDRIIKADGTIIVEEWKSSRTLRPWHRAQMGVYFLLVEEQLRIRPSHGFIVCGDGSRHRIENSDDLRAWVLEMAGQIRAARAVVAQPIPVEPVPGQCRLCGMRGHCSQARL